MSAERILRRLQVVVSDTVVAPSFMRECYTFNPGDPGFQLPPHLAHLKKFKNGSPQINAALRACVSDEHYIATLLAANGLDDEVSTQPLPRTLNPLPRAVFGWLLTQCVNRVRSRG